MRRTGLALAAAACGVLAAAAFGQQDERVKVGDWAPDVEAKAWINATGTLTGAEIPTLRENRGLVTVIVFWVGHHEGGRYLLPYINVADYSGRFGGSGVTVIGLTDADRRRTEEWLRESKVFFPVGVESKSAEEYDIRTFPSIVVVDPEGKVAFKGPPSDNFFKAIADVQEKTPPTRTNPEEAARAARWLDEAREHIRAGNFRRSYVLAADAWMHSVLGDRLKSEAFAFADLLELMAGDRIAQAEVMIDEKNYREAAATLVDVRRSFRGTDASRDARDLIEKYEKEYEEFKTAMSQFGDERTAAKLLLDAREDVRLHRFGDGYLKLERIANEFGETEAADYAREMMDKMKSNAAVWSVVIDKKAESDCRQWLAQARSYNRAGRKREARELFERVMNSYPESSYAQEAKEELIRMRP